VMTASQTHGDYHGPAPRRCGDGPSKLKGIAAKAMTIHPAPSDFLAMTARHPLPSPPSPTGKTDQPTCLEQPSRWRRDPSAALRPVSGSLPVPRRQCDAPTEESLCETGRR
jgi:hypothetical protein